MPPNFNKRTLGALPAKVKNRETAFDGHQERGQ